MNPAACTGMAALATGAAETSLPPWVVPTTAVSPAGNTGVTATSVAPNSGLWVEAVMVTPPAGVTVARVLDDLPGSSTETALMVTVPAAAGAVQAPVAAFMLPALAVQVTVPRNPPVTLTVNACTVPPATVGAAGLIAPTATVWGVMATLASAWSPAPLVARR